MKKSLSILIAIFVIASLVLSLVVGIVGNSTPTSTPTPSTPTPVITHPGAQDSHNDIGLNPTLTWTSPVEATGFELILAHNCDWENPMISATGSETLGPDTAYQITQTQTLQEGANYCWKVRAVYSDNSKSPWSDTGTFTTIY